MKGIYSMKRIITATSGRSTSKEYIKETLFDYLADYDYLEIDGVPAQKIVDQIQDLRPYYDVDDVLALATEDQISIPNSIAQLKDEL